MYLTLYQLDVVANVWEPFFGNGSQLILKESSIARMLPVPDALLGAVIYLVEAVTECLGNRQRWRSWPSAVFATGLVAAGLLLAGMALVACQAFVFRAFCTLCLLSAACSLAIAVVVAPEVMAAADCFFGVRRRDNGTSPNGELGPEASGSR
jgi:hypothetical protein